MKEVINKTKKNNSYLFYFTESLETCKRDYQKIGCFKEKRVQNHDLLVFDRDNVKWGTIAAYLHQ